ncbi:phosphoribosylformylglycinamidine synthase I [Candidatus Woesearchaeota archaeon]|nr:phosphoribosylformylglycinamidine synthase I [Candidatus Woesearchaeota archaeon]
MVRALILRSAGINCNDETEKAFQLAGAETEQVHINEIISGAKKLDDYQILAIPGGFSYGDDLGGGKILGNELSNRLKEQLHKFVADKKLVIGICNGFQVLVKTGILPWEGEQTVTLAQNNSKKFECRWVRLTKMKDCAFTKGIDGMYLPVAHGEGKLVTKDKDVLEKLQKQVVFKYCDEKGNETSEYPDNPNGSVENIAGICNETGTVMGMMPHPERHLSFMNSANWTRNGKKIGDGLKIFQNAVEYAEKNLVGK